MTIEQWEQIRDRDFPGYRITGLVTSNSDRALFRAVAETLGAEEFTIGFRDTKNASAAEDLANRFREASFLNHPNLAKISAAGTFAFEDHLLVYYVAERFSRTLAGAEFPGLEDVEILRSLAPPIVAGLKYLHDENLVYCALRPQSVWWSGQTWKLADFGELRLAGTYSAAETRRLLIREDLSCPPEAYEGIVSPAWDSWSLGSALHQVLGQTGPTDEIGDARTGQSRLVSSQCNELIQDLLEPDSAQRLTLSGFQERLSTLSTDATAREAPVVDHVNRTPDLPWNEAYSPPYIANLSASSQRKIPSWVAPLVLALAGLLVLAVSTLSGGANKTGDHPNLTAKAKTSPVWNSGTVMNPALPTPLRGGERSAARKSDPEQAVSAVLSQWVNSTRARNVDQQVDCYAPVVDRYFGRKHMTRDNLRAEKRRVFSTIGRVQAFSLANLQFKQIAPKSVVVVADKRWNFPDRHFSGVAREELTLREIGGEWKISGEREVNQQASATQARPRPVELPAPVTSDPESILAGAR